MAARGERAVSAAATIRYFTEAYDGKGYYYASDEDPSSMVGAFDTVEEAIEDAKQNGYSEVRVGNLEPKASAKTRVTVHSSAPRPQPPQQSPDFLIPLMVPKKVYGDMVQHLALLTRDAPEAVPTEADKLVLEAIEHMGKEPERWFTFQELLEATGASIGKLRNSISAYRRRVYRDKTRPLYRTKMISGVTYYKHAG